MISARPTYDLNIIPQRIAHMNIVPGTVSGRPKNYYLKPHSEGKGLITPPKYSPLPPMD